MNPIESMNDESFDSEQMSENYTIVIPVRA
jgi:hypothetical protein